MKDIHLNKRVRRIMSANGWFYGPTPYERYLSRAREVRNRVIVELSRAAWQAFRCRVWVPLARWRRRQSAIRVLMELSDRQLSDIGLTRGEIPEAVDRALLRDFGARPCSETISPAPKRTRVGVTSEVKKAA